jgi:hypothetical protein
VVVNKGTIAERRKHPTEMSGDQNETRTVAYIIDKRKNTSNLSFPVACYFIFFITKEQNWFLHSAQIITSK